MGVQFIIQGGQFSIRGFNIPWMKTYPGVNLPWGSKYHDTGMKCKLICNSSLYTHIPKIKSISPSISKKSVTTKPYM